MNPTPEADPTPPPAAISRADARSEDAVAAVRRYLMELADRLDHNGPPPDDPSTWGLDALVPPHGVMLVAREPDGRVVGCGGVQVIDDAFGPGRVAEVKRMWVDPDVRGSGLGRRLLAALEDAARGLGHHVVRLDTDARLTSAVALYRRAGYREIPAYNDNPYPDLWFEKDLTASG